MELQYRQGTLSDLDRIESLVRNAVMQMRRQGIEQWDEIYPVREDFAQDIGKKQLFVGAMDADIAVVYTINHEYDEAYESGQWREPDKPFCILHRLCVDPQYQNQGVAGRTMAYIERTAFRQGERAVRLDAFSENPYSLKLYARCGYTRVGTAEWRKGTFYLMEKYLT